ncbi:MAG TPA: hypothetical protein DCY27_01190 [Desulfobacterales bacterium]|nr:hypothetical protein [Desulfobacterales bacterium]
MYTQDFRSGRISLIMLCPNPCNVKIPWKFLSKAYYRTWELEKAEHKVRQGSETFARQARFHVLLIF